MNKKLLLSLGLLTIPVMASAGGVKFDVLTDSYKSAQIQSHVVFHPTALMMETPQCQDIKQDNSPLSVSKNNKKAVDFSLTTAPTPKACYPTNKQGYVEVTLFIDLVNGFNKKGGSCQLSYLLAYNDDTVKSSHYAGGINIMLDSSGDFNCSTVSLKK